tara:strand:+ start:7561 stop:7800 length:240 start_codon:yes stop_codon:yes gene_type:complete
LTAKQSKDDDMIDDNDITVSIPLADLVQLYNALDMLVDEANDADVECYLPHAVLEIATSRRDKFKARIADGLHIDLRGA